MSKDIENSADKEKHKNSNQDLIKYRKEGRLIAFKTLFSYDFDNKDINELLKFGWLDADYNEESLFYARYLIQGTLKNLDEIDSLIKEKSKNWDFDRLSYVDRAVLRFSIFCLIFEKDLAEKIVINEAIEIVKNFGTNDSYRFVNGILDAIKKNKEQK